MDGDFWVTIRYASEHFLVSETTLRKRADRGEFSSGFVTIRGKQVLVLGLQEVSNRFFPRPQVEETASTAAPHPPGPVPTEPDRVPQAQTIPAPVTGEAIVSMTDVPATKALLPPPVLAPGNPSNSPTPPFGNPPTAGAIGTASPRTPVLRQLPESVAAEIIASGIIAGGAAVMAAPRFKQFVEWLRTTTGSTPDESIERLVQKFDDAYVGETAKERLLEAFPELRASKAASSLSGMSSDPKNIQVLAHLSDEQIKDQIRRIRSLIAGNLEGIATPSSLETETCGAIRTLVLMIEERVDRNGVEALKPLGLTEEELAAWELRVRAAEEAQGPKPRAS